MLFEKITSTDLLRHVYTYKIFIIIEYNILQQHTVLSLINESFLLIAIFQSVIKLKLHKTFQQNQNIAILYTFL